MRRCTLSHGCERMMWFGEILVVIVFLISGLADAFLPRDRSSEKISLHGGRFIWR